MRRTCVSTCWNNSRYPVSVLDEILLMFSRMVWINYRSSLYYLRVILRFIRLHKTLLLDCLSTA